MKKSKRFIGIAAAILSCCMFFITGCASAQNFEIKKESDEMVKFVSSDEGLDNFLNDYLHRHLRYDDYRIGNVDLGGDDVMFSKEWSALSMYWFNCTDEVLNTDRFDMMRTFLHNVPQDEFGYVWQAYNTLHYPMHDANTYYHGFGWPFPTYLHSYGLTQGWEFNENDLEGWTVYGDHTSTSVGQGLATIETAGSEKLGIDSGDLYDETGLNDRSISTKQSPFLEVDLRMLVSDVNAVDDVYIRFKNTDSDEWYEISQKEWGLLDVPMQARWEQHLYFPMYLHPEWGTDKWIRQIQIEVRAEEGQTLSGRTAYNFVRCGYDTRHSNNNCILINTGKIDYEFTNDAEELANNITRYRKAMLFLLDYLEGRSGLLSMNHLVGHGGNPKGDANYYGDSLGNGYWDILLMPEIDLQSNMYFYNALRSMAYLERAAAECGIEVPKTEARVRSYENQGQGEYVYSETAESLDALADKVAENLRQPADDTAKTGFWDDEKGRFFAGYDAKGNRVDYGFLMWNIEMVTSGIATQEQGDRIVAWLDGEVIQEGDTAVGGTPGEGQVGIYDNEFAPRATTIKNYEGYFWGWGGGDFKFGDQVQDGGSIMYTSYYDLMTRLKARGADNAFERLKGIQSWYEKVQRAAEESGVGSTVSNERFYRVYYAALGVPMQGWNTSGGVGLDAEFLESSLTYAAVPLGFFGISSEETGVLKVSPSLPSSLNYWKIENLMYCGVKYDLTMTADGVMIDAVRGDTTGLSIKIALPAGKAKSVYVNGSLAQSVQEGDRLVVTIPFAAAQVVVR